MTGAGGGHMGTNLNDLFLEATGCLARYLEEILPSLSADWWKQSVLSNLSFQQRRLVADQDKDSLKSLDLAALLRILDRNWYEVSRAKNLTTESRHFVKEMLTVRHRWAHIDSGGVSDDDMYRDLDTLYRFSLVIGAEESLLQEIIHAKKAVIAESAPTDQQQATVGAATSEPGESPSCPFEPGQIVVLKSDAGVRGAVVSILEGHPENRIQVFADGGIQTYYESQLKAEAQQSVPPRFLACEEFHSYLTALHIRYPGLSTLYSLNAARIDFIPYQFRPVLRFIRSDRPRLLIADGVGVGKTIEAGLILRELRARRDLQSVLIICPRPLVTERKWSTEMKRFDENFIHLDGPSLRHCINEMDLEGVWPDQYDRTIIPYSLFDEALLHGTAPNGKRKTRKGLLELDPPPRFDLVIVDEAHHIRNTDTFRHKAVRFFCDHAEAVVFLTATPIQLGNHDLFVLLNTLRPDLIIDEESFEHMSEPNPFINRAVGLARSQEEGWATGAADALDQAAKTAWGQSILRKNPEFNRVRTLVSEGKIETEERVQLINDLEGMHTFSGMINRTRRRDIGDFTIRQTDTVLAEFTPSQKELHDDLLGVQAEIFSRLHGDMNVKFMMTTIRRQAASCLFGLVPFLEEILTRHLDEISWIEADDFSPVPQNKTVDCIESRIEPILEKARLLDPRDPKLDALRNIIRDKQKLENNKIMLFSSFRHTLRYLHGKLEADGIRVGLIHGGVPDEDRIMLRSRFEMHRDQKECIDILLFSEIGCEGLDYQFCDCMVNYDLPWNPMKIEQRIGRIDRWGQQSEKVAIVNMITPDTVDADIYERCLARIGVFQNALGGSEEILGEITQGIRNIAENYSLSEDERREKLQQLADNKIRLIQEQDVLEAKQVELFGIHLPQEQMKREVEQASSFWLSPASILRLTETYLHRTCKTEQEHLLGDKGLKTLRGSQEARGLLLRDFQKLSRNNTSAYRTWEKWLKGGDPHFQVTFDSSCATEHPEAAFITPLHPLVRQASNAIDVSEHVVTQLKVNSQAVPEGRYAFAVYQWKFHGIREDLELQPVAVSDQVTEELSTLLQLATEHTSGVIKELDKSIWDDLDVQHHRLWSAARLKHQQRTRDLADYRRESLITSHRARISLLEEQLSQAANEKIQTMRKSQITAAEADYSRRLQELDIAMERAEVTASTVAYGVIHVEGELQHAE
jgi:ATP-dependent helicase HepA